MVIGIVSKPHWRIVCRSNDVVASINWVSINEIDSNEISVVLSNPRNNEFEIVTEMNGMKKWRERKD